VKGGNDTFGLGACFVFVRVEDGCSFVLFDNDPVAAADNDDATLFGGTA
jgi:hypothetical protein